MFNKILKDVQPFSTLLIGVREFVFYASNLFITWTIELFADHQAVITILNFKFLDLMVKKIPVTEGTERKRDEGSLKGLHFFCHF